MKKPVLSAAFSLMCLIGLAALPRVAVLDILAQPGIDPSVVVPVTETIMEEVVGARAYVVLDRAYVEQVLKEMEFDLSGLTADTQATKAGQFLGADYVVTGKVQTIGDAYFLVAKMIEVRSGVIVAQASSQGEGKLTALLGLSRTVGGKLVAGSPISPLEPLARPEAAPTVAAPPSAAKAQEAPASETAAEESGRRIKAGFIYPWGVDDLNVAVNAAFARLKKAHSSWLDVVVFGDVQSQDYAAAIDKLVNGERCDIVFSCDWSLKDEMEKAARKYPGTKFESAFGDWKDSNPPNLGVFGYNTISHQYLEGLVAGCLSASGKIGVLSETVEGRPWTRQMVNAYGLGVLAANPKAQLLVFFLPDDHWNHLEVDQAAVRALADKGCDFILGAVSPAVVQALEPLGKSGKKVRTFISSFSYSITPSVIVSGPLENWSVFFEKPLLALKHGNWKGEGRWPQDSYAFGGGAESFNPAFLSEIQSKKLKTPDLGTLSLLELVGRREAQIAAEKFEFFVGPIKDQKGTVRIKAGVRPDGREIDAIDWFVENVKIVGDDRGAAAVGEGGGGGIKAGFIYPWWDEDENVAANIALMRLKKAQSSWLDIVVVRNPEKNPFPSAVYRLVTEEKCGIIFCCDWSFRKEAEEAAREFPETKFVAAFGDRNDSSPPNYAVFGFNLYAHEYLEGFVAGALSASGKIGVLAEGVGDQAGRGDRIDINAYALGVLAADPKAQVHVCLLPPGHWDNPEGDKATVKALAAKGCDFILGIVTPDFVRTMETLGKPGKRVRTFLPGFSYTISPEVIVAGPLQDWGSFFEKYTYAVKRGNWKGEAWYPTASYRFGGGGESFNPAFLGEIKSKKTKTPDFGSLSLLELVGKREAQITANEFEPFTGPIKDQKGKLRIDAGVRADWRIIEAIDWYVENVKIVKDK